MKQKLVIFISLVILWANSSADNLAPNFTLFTTEGQRVELSELHGRVVVLVFLDKRNGQSILTARSMETRLWRNNFQNRMIYLFGVLVGASQTEAIEFKRGLNLTFPVLYDSDRSVWERYKQSEYLPFSAIVDKNGYLVYTKQGFSAEEIVQKINEIQASNIYFTTWWKIKELFRKAE